MNRGIRLFSSSIVLSLVSGFLPAAGMAAPGDSMGPGPRMSDAQFFDAIDLDRPGLEETRRRVGLGMPA